MIVIDAQIESDLLSARGLRTVSRNTNRFVMTDHKNKVLPKHFQSTTETRPGGVYKYRKRDKGYMISKARNYGHQRPLVKTGELRRAVLASAKVTATAFRGRLIARGSTKSPLTDAHLAEIEIVSDQEQQDMAELWARVFVTLAQQPEHRRKVRHRNAQGRFIRK